jgi:anthranilate phosphoribosyltransferase
MNLIMSGQATDSQIAAFLTALRMKGESIDEITGFAEVMREKAVSVDIFSGCCGYCGHGGRFIL